MKKCCALLLAAALLFGLAGCSGIAPALPEQPTEFSGETFVNPSDPEDTYLSIDYNGRTYIGYGTLKGTLRKDDVGECLGYVVHQDGVKMEDERICLLQADPDANYLVRLFAGGFMDQPDFFRAVDTAGKEIPTPAFIDDLGYDFWK